MVLDYKNVSVMLLLLFAGCCGALDCVDFKEKKQLKEMH